MSESLSASSLSESQRRDLAAEFSRFDKNGDGRICLSELETVLRSLGEGFAQVDVNRLMNRADRNKDGFISLDEFLQLQESAHREDKEQHDLLAAFQLLDRDSDGFISPAELHVMMVASLGDENVTVRDCAKMIKAVDQDGDGKCNFADFQVLMKGM